MRVLVAGATGFLGRHVCDQLVQSQHDVTALCRTRSAPTQLARGVRVIQTDKWDAGSLRPHLAGMDVAVHLGGFQGGDEVSPEQLWHANATLTTEVAEAACGQVSRFVFVSSVRVFGINRVSPITESTPPSPNTLYGKAKLAAEEAVATRFKQSGTVLRMSEIYGPGDRRSMFFRMAKMLRRHPVIWLGAGRNRIHPCQISDAVLAVHAAVTSPNSGTFLVAGPRAITAGDALAIIAKRLRVTIPRLRVPTRLARGVAGIGGRLRRLGIPFPVTSSQVNTLCDDRCYDLSFVEQALGFVPKVDPTFGLAQFAQWITESGALT